MRKYRLTKSKFILGQQCVKALYLDVYNPDLAYMPYETLVRFRKGRDFEQRVKETFEDGIDISKELGKNISRYPDLTANLLKIPGEVTLFEAGFIFNEVLVLADVVHKSSDGDVSVYEIKNSDSVKEVFRRDVCLQHYVINNCIDNLTSFCVIHNDGNGGTMKEELLSEAREAEPLIAKQVEEFKEVLQGFEPDIAMDDHCLTPYECPYRRYCQKIKASLD